ncbi:MAG: hypothetical protein U5R31_15775 [Acidimicrobiia bacterium]|nr:hypothetical protein [Acidimicrobiia bacterium]
MIVPRQILAPLDDEPDTPRRPFDLVTSTGTRLPLPRGGEHARWRPTPVAPSADPVLSGQNFLADLAVRHTTTTPGRAGVVAVLPDDRPVSDGFLDTVLGGLGQPSMLRPATLDGLFRDTPPAAGPAAGSTLVRQLLPQPGPDLGDYPNDLRAVARRVAGLRSLLGADTPLPPLVEVVPAPGVRAATAPADRRL